MAARKRRATPGSRRAAASAVCAELPSCQQIETAADELVRIGALPHMDLEPTGLQDRLELRTDVGERGNRQSPVDTPALTGPKGYSLHTFELQQRSGDAGERIAHEQKQDGLAVDGALVVHEDGHLDTVGHSDNGWGAAQAMQPEGAVGQAVAEAELRRHRD